MFYNSVYCIRDTTFLYFYCNNAFQDISVLKWSMQMVISFNKEYKDLICYLCVFQGTIEEKIYQRQISKQGLSGAVIDAKDKSDVQFSKEDLKVDKDKFLLLENKLTRVQPKDIWVFPTGPHHFLARLHFSAEELLLYPGVRSASASTFKMLGQMLKSWNFNLSVFFVAF